MKFFKYFIKFFIKRYRSETRTGPKATINGEDFDLEDYFVLKG